MKKQTVLNASGKPIVETFQRIEYGECRRCETPIDKVVGSSYTPRKDGIRYAATGEGEGWCLVRCRTCGAAVDEVWQVCR